MSTMRNNIRVGNLFYKRIRKQRGDVSFEQKFSFASEDVFYTSRGANGNRTKIQMNGRNSQNFNLKNIKLNLRNKYPPVKRGVFQFRA